MKIHFLKNERMRRRVTALLLSVLMWMGCVWFTPRVSAVDLVIDDSGFKDPTIDHMYVYEWKEGIPPVDDKHQGKKIPILMTWDDKYYFGLSQQFMDCIENNVIGNDNVWLHGWSTNKKNSGYVNGSYDKDDGQYPFGLYYQNLGYQASFLSNVSLLDYSLLSKGSYFVTFGAPPDIPNLIPCVQKNTYTVSSYVKNQQKYPMYAIEFDLDGGFNSGDNNGWCSFYPSTYVGSYDDDGGFRLGENYLIGIRENYVTHEVIPVDYWFDEHNQYAAFYWTLYALNHTSIKHLDAYMGTNDLDDRLIPNSSKPSDYTKRYWLEYCCWYVQTKTVNGKKYACFFTEGARENYPGFYICDESFYGCDSFEKLHDLSYRAPQITLSHFNQTVDGVTKARMESRGNYHGDWIESTFKGDMDLWGADSNSISFRCFYGEPVLMNLIQTDYTVEKGQVSNLDGPIAIANGSVITVKEGGTLSINGWCINNGTIKVEEGGTLWVQDGSCVNRYNEGTHIGGGIISNGLIIVGEGSKLIGGGTDGIQLLAGSHVVNYGCVASENFKVVNDYTIELRGQGFVRHGKGNGVKHTGSTTFNTPLDYANKTFSESAQIENTCYDNVNDVPNAIYSY